MSLHRFALFLALAIGFAAASPSLAAEAPLQGEEAAKAAYRGLLAVFPEDRQGYGRDWFLGVTEDQPMTYGLVLSAEARHFRGEANDESRRRVRKATRWLLDHSDLDGDGRDGWGLPQAWDANSDGSTNPPHQPYTITTAIVLDGLLDALAIPEFWSEEERKEIRGLVVRVVRRWCQEVWSDGFSGGYFWYSPSPEDNVFNVNAPAMFLGSLARLLRDHADALAPEDRQLVQGRADRLARAVVATAELKDGEPSWLYTPVPNKYNRARPNDLLHHVYTLWGVEWYRQCGGAVKIPWSRQQAIKSNDRFWNGASILNLPKEVSTTKDGLKGAPARLWSAGMLLAFYAQWGNREKAASTLEAIRRDYGPWPRLLWYPQGQAKTDEFFLRDAAHVLFGLAIYAYPPTDTSGKPNT